MQSPSMQQFQCSLHGTERATTAVYSWPSCGGGCVQNASCIACFTACGTWGKGGAWDKCDCPDECYPEGVIADQTIRILKDKVAPGGAAGQPFFHACGFKRPHLSYRAPTKYFDMCTITLLCLLSADSHLLLVVRLVRRRHEQDPPAASPDALTLRAPNLLRPYVHQRQPRRLRRR